MEASNRPIGVFDSGVGGLTVAQAIRQILPGEQIVYFGDTAHLPYGDKSEEAIRGYSRKITEFLLGYDAKVVHCLQLGISLSVRSSACRIRQQGHNPRCDQPGG